MLIDIIVEKNLFSHTSIPNPIIFKFSKNVFIFIAHGGPVEGNVTNLLSQLLQFHYMVIMN